MKTRLVTSRTCGIQLLCASLLIHNFVEAAPQGIVNHASFTPDHHKTFNDLPGQIRHSGLVLPAIQLKGPNFIPVSEPTLFISQPQEPKISISQPLETSISISQPPESKTSFSQPQFTNRNSLPADFPVPQHTSFVNQQPPANDFINSQPILPVQQPQFVFRSQPSIIPPQHQIILNSQPFLGAGVLESATVIREGETVIIPHETVSVDSPINQVETFNQINNFDRPVISTGGESPLVSLFPEDQVVEVPIPFLRNSASISVGPVTGNTVNQNQLQQDHNSVQPQVTFVDSSAKNLNTVNSVDTQADNFDKRGPSNLGSFENTFDVSIETGDFSLGAHAGGRNNIGVPLSSVLNINSGNNNVGVPISSTIISDNGNNNIGTPQATLSNTFSGDNSFGVPLSSAVNIASEDNTLTSPQNPFNNEDINLLASLSSAINADTNLRTSVITDTDTNIGGDFGSLTLGEVLLSMNGQDGIVVLPMDGLGGSTVSELLGTNDNQKLNITFRPDDGSSDGDLGSLLDTFISDYADDSEFEDLPPAPPSPPNLFRGTLADTLFVKGQWLGTLLGGLVDLGGAISGSLKQLKQKS